MRVLALVATVLLVTAGAAPATVGAQQASTYEGAHLAFTAQGDALTDYRVDGTTFFDSVTVQSKQAAEREGLVSVGTNVGSVASLAGSQLTVDSRTTASATVSAESGATIHAHDNTHGIAVVESGDRSQYVLLNVSEGTEARYEGDAMVTVETESGAEAVAFVVGEGTIGVNDQGNVAARVGDDGTLAVRTYDRARGTDDRNQERLIANAVATGEVYVMQQDGEQVVDTVTYGPNTSVEVTEQGSETVEFVVDRPTADGTVLFASVSKGAFAAADSLSVVVDGEVAAEAATYDELAIAADGGQTSKYLVQQSSNREATTEVGIGVNHFSERTVSLRGGQSDSSTATTNDGHSESTSSETAATASTVSTTSATSPGFGLVVGLVGLLVAIAGGRRHS
jgi:PGF-CTERM protein